MKTKAGLRQTFRAICHAIPQHDRDEAAQAVAQIFTQQSFFIPSQRIACYLAVKNELDCSHLIAAIWQANKACYVPILAPNNETALLFARYRYGDALHLNRYAILEPVSPVDRIVPGELDIALLPMVAFDYHGYRLGTGGGYYDRTFAFSQGKTSKKPLLIGIAYTAQAADSLPTDPWDIRLDGIITEQGFFDTAF